MKEFEVLREFNFPVREVFEAWANPEQMQQWWGPKDFELSIKTHEFTKGGLFLYSISASTGAPLWGRFVFGEIVRPLQIEFTNSFSNERGEIVRAPFSDTWPLEIFNQMTLAGKDSMTILHLKGRPIRATEQEEATYESHFESLHAGFGNTLNQLQEFLTHKDSF